MDGLPFIAVLTYQQQAKVRVRVSIRDRHLGDSVVCFCGGVDEVSDFIKFHSVLHI